MRSARALPSRTGRSHSDVTKPLPASSNGEEVAMRSALARVMGLGLVGNALLMLTAPAIWYGVVPGGYGNRGFQCAFRARYRLRLSRLRRGAALVCGRWSSRRSRACRRRLSRASRAGSSLGLGFGTGKLRASPRESGRRLRSGSARALARLAQASTSTGER
jgi:hypothetical protein